MGAMQNEQTKAARITHRENRIITERTINVDGKLRAGANLHIEKRCSLLKKKRKKIGEIEIHIFAFD